MSTVDKRRAGKLVESGATTITHISSDFKPAAAARETAKFFDAVKKDLAKGKGVVLVSIAADKVVQQ